MRLIGGKDYYDNALGYDAEGVVFVRESNRILSDAEIDCPLRPMQLTLHERKLSRIINLAECYDRLDAHDEYLIARLAVIFCGKIYRGVIATSDKGSACFWHAEKFREWLSTLGIEVAARQGRLRPHIELATRDLVNMFGREDVSNALLDWLIMNRVVIAIRFPTRSSEPTSPTWEINSDRLKDVEFYRVLNSFEAFQEIEMWVGGVLPQREGNMTVIDDETRIAKHGFDKTSFRRR